MVNRTNLDMAVLRTFAAGFELGSFARAADRLGRSQSAISTQLRKLEEQVGQPLVQKSGRRLVLTPVGESLLSYARRILELNDEALATIRGADVEGWVRLGLQQDFAESWLPSVLGRFARAHPRVQVEVRAERSASLVADTVKGKLDLALTWGAAGQSPHAEQVASLPMVWIGRAEWSGVHALGSKPLPLVAFESPCVFRDAGVTELDAADVRWRLVFTSPSLAGLWAATEAGLGITLRTAIGVPEPLSILDPARYGLPALPRIPLALHRADAQPSPAVARLADILRETIAERTASLDRFAGEPAAAIDEPASGVS
jgi:DNA-binding transcriptional LysR family regulator